MTIDLDRLSPFAAMESMNMDETHELLPCPFCGPGQSHVALWFDNSAKRWRVGCGRCGCSTGTSPHEDGPQPAAARWNNRPKMFDDTMRTRFAQFVKDLRHHIDRYGLVKVDNSEVSFLESVGSTLSTAPVSPPSSVGEEASAAIVDIAAERRRQIEVEGWTPEHDDRHDTGELARGASCYALSASEEGVAFEDFLYDDNGAPLCPRWWPWDADWWKPNSPRRDLVKAGALIIAEIERLDRMTPTPDPRSLLQEDAKR